MPAPRRAWSASQPEFSTCFGAPFLPRHPSVYADLLRDYINKHKVDVWLVNSGWTGGKYGVGRRMPIKATRTLLTAALDGSLKNADFRTDPYFGFSVPTSVPGVEPHLLNPFKTWKDKAEFDKTARELVGMFQKNFAKYEQPRHARHQGGGAGSAHRGGVRSLDDAGVSGTALRERAAALMDGRADETANEPAEFQHAGPLQARQFGFKAHAFALCSG